MTPVLFSRPFSWITIFPERWSSMISNSPMYPESLDDRLAGTEYKGKKKSENVVTAVNSNP